ncbi:MAG: LPS assembly protein LptD [Steroidobacteraceae bacterium]|nr:LPS assembly protein LptD [Steroidobacteraceae bacterium]
MLVALALAVPGLAAAQSCPVPLPAPSTAERVVDPDAPIEVSSEGAEVTDAGDAVLSGEVRVRQGDRQLTAQDARYDAARQAFVVQGSVEYRDPQIRLGGDTATWSTTGGGRFGGAQFEIPGRAARGSAETITLTPEGDLGLDEVEYTTCPPGERDWFLRADRIDIDQSRARGTGRNVRLDFKGVPILYTPVISFPVGDARKTGFLFPTYGQSSRNGFELAAPWYWNVAPNYDATLTPGVMSKRGVTLDGEFRWLGPLTRGQFDAEWLPGDRLADQDRSYLRLAHRWDVAPRLRFDLRAAHASDGRYFEDFGLGPEGTSVLFLERIATATYLDRHWRAIALVQEFQTIDRLIAPADRPYARAPQLAFRGRWGGTSGLGFEMRGEAVNFQRDVGVTGARFDVEPTLRWAWRRPGAFFVPAVSFRATQYALDDVADGADDAPRRTAPLATVDAGLVFERSAGRRVQTLEPRLVYTYVPFREQSDLPLFDTGLPDLNLVQLFRPERYVGADRLGDANQLAAGATGRLIDADTGRELVAATVGQIRYFDTPRVRLPGEPPTTRESSDAFAQVTVSAFDRWNVQLAQQYDTQERRSVRSLVRVQYDFEGGRVANLGYRFRRGLLEQLEGSFAWPVSESWNLYGRHVYSLRDSSPIESLAGLEYRACCWRVRLVGSRYVSSRTGEQDTGVSLQLELNGLSNVGTPADAFLRRPVR